MLRFSHVQLTREFQTYIFGQCRKSEIGIGSFARLSHFPTIQIPQEFGEFGINIKYIKITTKLYKYLRLLLLYDFV